jgi:3',5'-cyclic AMP phosphodiesterase CpdA
MTIRMTTALAMTFVVSLTAGNAEAVTCTATSYEPLALTRDPATPLPAKPIFRFVQLSDVHIYDDDASAAVSGNATELALEPTIGNGSAQRAQDEYTDEVLNAVEKTVNACNASKPIELMIATGDNVDTMTLNEVRRYIDNLDGRSGQDTAYEANCGYLTSDPNQRPKLAGALPCGPELQPIFEIPTGKRVADSQSAPPDVDEPTDQLAVTRSLKQLANTTAASLQNTSLLVAPGLPPALRCNDGQPGCANVAMDIPYFAVFGNHDGAIRGTLTMQRPFQASPLVQGRYFLQSQREWINEFFHTATTPLGHGFNHVDPARWDDPDDRNDGYYAFDAAGGKVRMIVLNTLYDGVLKELHRSGQTNADTQGLATGGEVTNPIGLEAGVIGEEQFLWLESELTASAGKPVLVFSHHPDRSFTERRVGFAVEGRTSDQLDELLGRHPNVVAHIAGHTHENVVRPCKQGDCAIGTSGPQPVTIGHPFWRVETASLIDYPQEGRIIELYDLCQGLEGKKRKECRAAQGTRWALKMTMISPDQDDADAKLSHDLSIMEATCNLSQILGGPLSSGPYDQSRVETIVTNGQEAAVQQKFCFGEASLAAAEGDDADRNVILLP